MIFVLSPAKTLDYSIQLPAGVKATQPRLAKDAVRLAEELKSYSPKKIAKLMNLSDKLADLNYQRYQAFEPKFNKNNAGPALAVFKGDVYKGMTAESYGAKQWQYAQDHLRILSGLYGVLRPLDLMQAYRLEMGTRLKVGSAEDLYAYWDDRITALLNKDIKDCGAPALINLASAEYFKSIRSKSLDAPVITPVFKEDRGGKSRVIALFAKRARGLMADFAINKQLKSPDDLKQFSTEGYRFRDSLSNDSEWVFVRKA